MTSHVVLPPPSTAAVLHTQDEQDDVLTVLLTGGEQAERDRLGALLLDQGAAVCAIPSLDLAAETMATYREATGACFDVLYALCDADMTVEGLSQSARLAVEVVAIRRRPWSMDEVNDALDVGNVLLLDAIPA
jgi:uncharacterized phosphosugar-binding protein